MKVFFKKHTIIFTICIIIMAICSNLITGFLQSFVSPNQTMFYLIEAIFKFGISAGLLILMVKWGYTKKADKKKLTLGFLLGSILLLFMAPNVIPFVIVNPILFDAKWGLIIAILLASLSIGLMEETGIRGLLLPLLCEKWKGKKHTYLKAALITSLLFGCIHLTWSIRFFITHGFLPTSQLLENLYQVYYAFCFGVLVSGIAIYTRNILAVAIWHGLCDFSAFIIYGILPHASIEFYNRQQMLNLHYVFYKYGISSKLPIAANLVYETINLLFIIIGIILILKAEKKYIKSN